MNAALAQTLRSVACTTPSWWGIALASVLSMLVVRGYFLPGHHTYPGLPWVIVGCWFLLWGYRARHARGRLAVVVEAGVMLIVGVHAFVQTNGGSGSELYALSYLAVAVVAATAQGATAMGLVAFAAVFAVVVAVHAEALRDLWLLGIRAAFTVGFGAIGFVCAQAEIQRVRSRFAKEHEAIQQKAQDDTRMFRLTAFSHAGPRVESRVHQGSVQEVRQALRYVLQLLYHTLDLHSCVLLMATHEGDQLCVVEWVSVSDNIVEGPFPAGVGAVGAAMRREVTTNLCRIRPGYTGICYYQGPVAVRSFIAMPVLDPSGVRAVLCADRVSGGAFGLKEEHILRSSTAHILRAFETERVFVELERSKVKQDVLYRVSQALSVAGTQQSVIEVGLDAAQQIVPYDFAAVTEYYPARRQHLVVHTSGERAQDFQGLDFRDNASLVSMVVKNRHYLPYRGEFDAEQQVLFTKSARLRGMSSLLVLPLVVREEPIGTLIVAAKATGVFGAPVCSTMQTLSNHLAVAMANARLVHQLEALATTDGLTGCLNKRAFVAEMEHKLMAAQRFGRKLSVIVIDLDHFKVVNDTYGHAIGDRVLQALGGVLHRVKRETDTVARYGGEEFCVLCEETGTSGARMLAERVREELAGACVHTDRGSLVVTASLGVATFPDHATTASDLFAQGDKALYLAKERGRNRVCTV